MRRRWFVLIIGLLLSGIRPLGSLAATAHDDGRGERGDDRDDQDDDRDDGWPHRDKTLYIWAGDQARVKPDFLAVIDFDPDSPAYGKVLRTVPIPPPGNVGNEPHHCHPSADKRILACGGLLSLLRGQNGIFFFNVSKARRPKFLFSTSAPHSSIADDFLPLPKGGFLLTDMGSASGGSPGRIVEIDRRLRIIDEYPRKPPLDGFNPHGISARFDLNLLVTSDFIDPASTLNVVPGDPVLRGSIRVWDLAAREIVRTIYLPTASGSMDLKLIPGDPEGRDYTAGMFDGLVYLIDTENGTAQVVFDWETIVPHIDTPVEGGMTQLLEMPESGDRLIFGSFQAGQIGMLDITDREHPVQAAIVNLGVNAGPHDIVLTDDNERLVATDYFLDEDDFGKIHFEGDHKVHVINVSHDSLELDTRFQLDFDTAFATPARPHGIEMK
jgi:56kDa selenium binding protein (SBP56)